MSPVMLAIFNIWLDDLLPMFYVIFAADAVIRNIHSLKYDELVPKHKAMVFFGLLISFLMLFLYVLVLFQLDHVINPDPAEFSALYVRPLMGLIIIYFSLSTRRRQTQKKVIKGGINDDLTNPIS